MIVCSWSRVAHGHANELNVRRSNVFRTLRIIEQHVIELLVAADRVCDQRNAQQSEEKGYDRRGKPEQGIEKPAIPAAQHRDRENQ